MSRAYETSADAPDAAGAKACPAPPPPRLPRRGTADGDRAEREAPAGGRPVEVALPEVVHPAGLLVGGQPQGEGDEMPARRRRGRRRAGAVERREVADESGVRAFRPRSRRSSTACSRPSSARTVAVTATVTRAPGVAIRSSLPAGSGVPCGSAPTSRLPARPAGSPPPTVSAQCATAGSTAGSTPTSGTGAPSDAWTRCVAVARRTGWLRTPGRSARSAAGGATS